MSSFPQGAAVRLVREFNFKPVDARFTHTLEPARPVTGIVTDKETGQPLAGVLVEMIPRGEESIRRQDAGPDHDGCIRPIPGRRQQEKSFWVTAFPDPGSGYIPVQMTQHNRWPSGPRSSK